MMNANERLRTGCITGNIEMVKEAVKQGADFEWRDGKGTTALGHAVMNVWPGITGFLLENGADPNSDARDGNPALIWSCAYEAISFLSVIEKLVEHGADVNAYGSYPFTPFLAAAANGKCDITEYLLEHGAVVDSRMKDNEYTALMMAVMNEDLPMVELLLSKGADASLIDHKGHSAMDMAKEAGSKQIIDLLSGTKSKASKESTETQ